MTAQRARRVHMLAGFTRAGRKVRAWCTCGDSTTPRVDEARAREALSEHRNSYAVCDRCGRDRDDVNLPHSRRYEHLQLLVDGRPHPDVLAAVQASLASDEAWRAWRERDQVLVCADDLETCKRLTQQREQTAELGQPGQPRLRVVR